MQSLRYLRRSATIMRQHVATRPPNRNRIERGMLVKLLTKDGPIIVNECDLGDQVLRKFIQLKLIRRMAPMHRYTYINTHIYLYVYMFIHMSCL